MKIKLGPWTPVNEHGQEFRRNSSGAFAGMVSHQNQEGVPGWGAFPSVAGEKSQGGSSPTVAQARKICDSALKEMGYYW